MEDLRNVLIACGERDPRTCAALTEEFGRNGYRVLRSEEVERERVHAAVDRLSDENGPVDALVYLTGAPVASTLLEGGAEAVAERVDSDLKSGVWWLQAVSRSMISNRRRGRITIVGHITAAVPTQAFSYSSNSQLALMNLSRGAALELAPHGLRLNTILRGWDAGRADQVAYVEHLQSLHQDDGIPLLTFTTGEEIAKTAMLLSDPTIDSLNGTLITLDGGFHVSRKIRQT